MNSLVALCRHTAHETNFLAILCSWKLETIYVSIPSESLLSFERIYFTIQTAAGRKYTFNKLAKSNIESGCVIDNSSQILTMSNSLILSISVPLFTPFVFWACGYSYIQLNCLPAHSLEKFFQTIQSLIPWAWVFFVIGFLGCMESLCILVLWFALISFWSCVFVQTIKGTWERQKRNSEEGGSGLFEVGVRKHQG